jgi:hypothetical protein
MIIKKSSLDTLVILLLMLAPVLPIFLARSLVVVFTTFLAVKIIFSNDLFLYFKKKIIILLLFIPGILGAIFTEPENLIRFLGFFLILLGFPFSSFKVKSMPVIVLSCIILFYLITTQLLLLSGNTAVLNFKDFGYSDQWSYIWDYGHTNEILKNSLFPETKVRSGGLYSNPNTFAGIVILYYFIFDFSCRNQNQDSNQNKKYWKIFFYQSILLFVLFSLLTANSRTIIIVFFAYLIFQNFFFFDFLLQFKIKKFLFYYLILLIGLLSVGLYNNVLLGFTDESGSIKVKFEILINYLKQKNLSEWVIGGNYNVHFDAEWGNWIGLTGFLGIFAFFVFYKMVYRFKPQMKALIFSFILISFGSTLFYNLLYVSILIPLFIISLSCSKQNLMKKNI